MLSKLPAMSFGKMSKLCWAQDIYVARNSLVPSISSTNSSVASQSTDLGSSSSMTTIVPCAITDIPILYTVLPSTQPSSIINSTTAILSPVANKMNLNFTWGSFSGSEMFNIITSAYDKAIHWRHNLFLVPSGATGTSFVQELA